jgi:hypothetical protein
VGSKPSIRFNVNVIARSQVFVQKSAAQTMKASHKNARVYHNAGIEIEPSESYGTNCIVEITPSIRWRRLPRTWAPAQAFPRSLVPDLKAAGPEPEQEAQPEAVREY